MWIKKKEIEQLSEFVKGYSSGEKLDIRVNKEGSFNILKNDIYALVNTKNEQIKAVETERDSLSDYMADISHQLKTPITSMMIMADLLEEAEPEKQTEFIHNIQILLNKMEWLVGALLKMAKLDAHAIDFIKNDIHTSELLEAVKPSVAILLDIHNLTIELKQDCTIHCDKRWTTEALTNIVKNAIEYSPDGSVIEIDSGENPMYSWISVRDSGMTGGQMSLTTMEGQKTATSVYGRDCSVTGYPIRFPEMVAREFPNAAYAARGTVTTPANINKLKGYIKNALQAQLNHEGYSVVEVLSPCPINWGLTPVNAMKRIEDELIPYYPLGEFKKREEAK